MLRKIIDENVPWQEITPGGVICTPGNASEFSTGNWRTNRPILNPEKCRQCLLCIPVCPDSSISVVGDRTDFDYNHCKGCGICAAVCAFHAISIVREHS